MKKTGVAGTRLGDWLSRREPRVPDAFAAHLVGDAGGGSAGDVRASLEDETRAALRDARAESGERRGAFRLLAADAYLTYACEAALESDVPGEGLLRVVEQVVGEAGNG